MAIKSKKRRRGMSRRIAIIGTGYVGLVAGVSFASKGNQVVCVDIDQAKINMLRKGIPTIHEDGLAEILSKTVLEKKTLTFTTNLVEAMDKSNIIIIAVGTPMGDDGSADLHHVQNVAISIGQCMKHSLIIVNKSTVPIGTAAMVRDIISADLQRRNLKDMEFHVVSNPEFLAEGRALRDMLEPNRIVVGADDPNVLEVMKMLYAPFTRREERFYGMSVVAAEFTKYAANWILAARISCINTVALLCETFGADAMQVRSALASDPRIGKNFLHISCGYGGSCFPKDVNALIHQAKMAGVSDEVIAMLMAPEILNNHQKGLIARKVVGYFGEDLSGRTFALWGLAFKKGTDDMRKSASIDLVNELIRRGAKVVAYDPLAMEQARKVYLKDLDGLSYVGDMYSALTDASALLVMTESDEYLSPDFGIIKSFLKLPIIIDGRNLYKQKELEEFGIFYYGIGIGLSLKQE